MYFNQIKKKCINEYRELNFETVTSSISNVIFRLVITRCVDIYVTLWVIRVLAKIAIRKYTILLCTEITFKYGKVQLCWCYTRVFNVDIFKSCKWVNQFLIKLHWYISAIICLFIHSIKLLLFININYFIFEMFYYINNSISEFHDICEKM